MERLEHLFARFSQKCDSLASWITETKGILKKDQISECDLAEILGEWWVSKNQCGSAVKFSLKEFSKSFSRLFSKNVQPPLPGKIRSDDAFDTDMGLHKERLEQIGTLAHEMVQQGFSKV